MGFSFNFIDKIHRTYARPVARVAAAYYTGGLSEAAFRIKDQKEAASRRKQAQKDQDAADKAASDAEAARLAEEQRYAAEQAVGVSDVANPVTMPGWNRVNKVLRPTGLLDGLSALGGKPGSGGIQPVVVLGGAAALAVLFLMLKKR